MGLVRLAGRGRGLGATVWEDDSCSKRIFILGAESAALSPLRDTRNLLAVLSLCLRLWCPRRIHLGWRHKSLPISPDTLNWRWAGPRKGMQLL